MALAQVNLGNLERFKSAVGLGTITPPFVRKKKWNHQPQQTWYVHSFEHIQAVVAMLWKFLGPEKREQAKTVLLAMHKNRRRGTNQHAEKF